MKIRLVYLLLIATIAALLLFLNQYNGTVPHTKANGTKNNEKKTKPDAPSDVQNRSEPFNRRVSDLIYTQHA